MRAMFKAMILAWLGMWKNMLKGTPYRTCRRDFVMIVIMDIVVWGILIGIKMWIQSDLWDRLLGLFVFPFGIATLTLIIRRLQDAGVSLLFALPIYIWSFFGCYSLTISHHSARDLFLAFWILGLLLVGFFTFVICLLPKKNKKPKV